MRYFMSILPAADYVTGGKEPPKAIMDAMGPYLDRSVASGALISTGGLKGPVPGLKLSGAGGRVAPVDGPFSEAKEVIGGYAVFEAPSREAALKLAAEFVQLHIDNGMPDISVEIREIAGGYNF